MVVPKERTPPTDREKQEAHGAPSDQGGAGQKMQGPNEPEPYYEGPEESQQQRRAEQTDQLPARDAKGKPHRD